MNKQLLYISAISAAIMVPDVLTPALAATTIDNSGVNNGAFSAFGSTNTATYGQTFSVSGSDTFLDSFSMFLRDRDGGSGTLDLRGYIAGWDGTKATNILFESGTQTMNAAGTLQEFAFDPNINLVSGSTYVAFLSISNLAAQPDSRFLMPGGSSLPGSFVFLNNGINFGDLTTQNWSSFEQDAWLKASLTASAQEVPEPAALSLLAAGLAALGLAHRRKAA